MKKPVSKIGTILIIVATVILAGIAIFTAYRLYELRQQSVAPNAPSSNPKADTISSPTSACNLSFTLSSATATPTATGSATPTPTGTGTATPTPTGTGSATPTPTGEPNSCGGTCGSNINCGNGLYCYNGYCRNPSCPSDTDCNCGASTPTPTSTATTTTYSSTTTPTPTEAALPVSGTNWPTFMMAGFGMFIILFAFLLAF